MTKKEDDVEELLEILEELVKGKRALTYEDYLNNLTEEQLDEYIKMGAESNDVN